MDEYVAVLIEGNNLIARHGLEGPGYEDFITVPFVPSDHRWVQLRGDGDTLYFETSSDGLTFEAFFSGPPPFPLTAVRPGVGSGNWDPILADVTVSFASVAMCLDSSQE